MTRRNQVWIADITYIRILTGFMYLAAVLDAWSRKVIGYAISTAIDTSLTLEALKMAIEGRHPGPGVIHHSDQGVQYASTEYVEVLKGHGFQISMARVGNPYENARMESFFKTLKCEEVYLWEYRTPADVMERLPYFLEEVYNQKRLHSALGYLSPNAFEELLTRGPRGVIPPDPPNPGGPVIGVHSNFVHFLAQNATYWDQGGLVALDHVRELIRVGVIIVGTESKLRVEGLRPYVKRIATCGDMGARDVYLVGTELGARAIPQIVEEAVRRGLAPQLKIQSYNALRRGKVQKWRVARLEIPEGTSRKFLDEFPEMRDWPDLELG